MAGKQNLPTRARDIAAMIKKLEHDPEALELVAALIEKLGASKKRRARKARRRIRSQ